MRKALIVVAALLLASCNSDTDRAKQAVLTKLKDPSSVQWRDVVTGDHGNTCGYFNARNSFGGYVGFKRFEFIGDASGGMLYIQGDPGIPDSIFDDCPKG